MTTAAAPADRDLLQAALTLERHPDATPPELACTVLGVPNSQPRPPAPVYPPCDDCGGNGWATQYDTNGDPTRTVEPCHCPQGQANKETA